MTWKEGTMGDLAAALIEAALEIAQERQFAPGFDAVFYFQLQGITFRVRVDVNEADLQTNLDIKG